MKIVYSILHIHTNPFRNAEHPSPWQHSCSLPNIKPIPFKIISICGPRKIQITISHAPKVYFNRNKHLSSQNILHIISTKNKPLMSYCLKFDYEKKKKIPCRFENTTLSPWWISNFPSMVFQVMQFRMFVPS